MNNVESFTDEAEAFAQIEAKNKKLIEMKDWGF